MIRFGLSWELTLSHHELNVTSKGQPQLMGAAHAPNEAALMSGGGSYACMHHGLSCHVIGARHSIING